MRDTHEKFIIVITTLCFLILFGFFTYMIKEEKTISIKKDFFGFRDKSSLVTTKEATRSSLSSAQSIASTGDTHTIFFGGRIITNPDSWLFRRIGDYHCPALEFYIENGIQKQRILTVVDQSFCNAKKVEVPGSLEIFPRGNLLFYVHTVDRLYIDTIRMLVESTQ